MKLEAPGESGDQRPALQSGGQEVSSNRREEQKGDVSSSVQTDLMSFSFVCVPGLSFQRCKIRM